MRQRRTAFTLVELLVVIGIIAVLIGILLPTLSRARESGNTIKCSANLRSIGQSIQAYLTEYKQTFPAAYGYVNTRIQGPLGTPGSVSSQTPLDPTFGYVHWSSLIYSKKVNIPVDNNGGVLLTSTSSIYHSSSGWDAFVCPSYPGNGLPPTNTFAGNREPNQTNDPSNTGNYIDFQAPRISYTVNEAIMGRNKYALANYAGKDAARVYKFVRVGQIRGSSETVLATEFATDWRIITGDPTNPSPNIVKSHRPIHGFTIAGDLDMFTEPPAAGSVFGGGATVFKGFPSKPSDVNPYAKPGQPTNSRLDQVGRLHGRGKDNKGRPLAKTNFLYVDGHVETKVVEDTLRPRFQWGDQFYSLSPNTDITSDITK